VKKIIGMMAMNGLAFICLSQPIATKEIPIPSSPLKIKMIQLEGGTYTMGNDKSINLNEKPAKKIQISPFWIGAYEITHDQFDAFFKDEQTSQGSKVDAITRPTPQYIDLSWNMGKEGGYPVNSMSVDAALMFCRWLYQKTGTFFRLPTEAEWEYACKAGTNTSYFFGDDPSKLPQYAWFKNNSNEKYQKVGQKKPNQWGLYDMLGNLAEWTMDQYDAEYFKKIKETDKDKIVLPTSRYPRSIRGGSYMDDQKKVMSTSRGFSETSWNKRDPQLPKSRWWLTDGMFVGFRIVSPVNQPTAEEAEKLYKLYLGN